MKTKYLFIPISLITGSFLFTNCNNQKKMIFKITTLKEQEIKIFYDVKEYPELKEDPLGNIIVLLDTAKVFYTSTQFYKIKNHRNIFCFKDRNEKCYNEDSELEVDGFVINVYSNFSQDIKNKDGYKNPYDQILIKKIKQ